MGRVLGWGVSSLVVLGLAGCGSGTGGSSGKAGASGKAGGPGTAGASGAAGGSGAAGTSSAAGAMGTAGAGGGGGGAGTAGTNGGAGTSGGAGAGTGDASADAPATPADGSGPFPDAGADANCGPARLDRVAPDLLLLLDRSGSMGEQLDGTTCPGMGAPCVTRWSECTKAVNQVVQETETSVNWGLKFFATTNTCGVLAGVTVPVGTKNATAISNSILSTQPGGNTPTRLAVQSAGAYLSALPDSNPKVLLLATDGLPNCMPGGSTTNDDSAGTVMAVKTLADSGIPVYVIGIGSDVVNQQNLEMIAIAGGRPRATAPAFYPVESSADLVDALRAIGAQSMPCTYALPFVPPDPANVRVSAANVRVPRDLTHVEGWDYDAALKSIKLYGTWCAKDQAGTLGAIDFIAGCQPGIAP